MTETILLGLIVFVIMSLIVWSREYFTTWINYGLSRARGYRRLDVNNKSALFTVNNLGDFVELEYVANHERTVLTDFLEVVKEYQSPTIFDIGANIGIYSLLANQANPEASIVAIEPYPTNAYQLLHNIKLNSADIDLVQTVISDAEEPVPMSGLKEDLTTDGTVSVRESGNIFSYSKTLPDLIDRGVWNVPNIIKIDVEGAEGKVFRGLAPIIDEIDILYYELHLENPSNIYTFDDDVESILNLFDDNGFSREQLTDHGEREIWKAVSK